MYNYAMDHNLAVCDPLLELVPLGCYVTYIYFSFCDGFGLRPRRKMIWGICFLFFSFLSFKAKGEFDLKIIIALSSVLAFVFALFQKRENKLKGKKNES